MHCSVVQCDVLYFRGWVARMGSVSWAGARLSVVFKSAHLNGYGGALSFNSLGFSLPLGPSPSRVRVEIESR